MTLDPHALAWRETHRARTAGKPRRDGDVRFRPMNAVRDGGWLRVLTRRELAVWLVLYSHANRDGTVRISHSSIGRAIGMRREHAARTTRALERIGLLRVRVRGRTFGQAGTRTANEYEMLVPQPHTNSATSGTNEEDD